MNDRAKLTNEARTAVDSALAPGEPVRVVVRGTFGSALVATDRRVLIWKKSRLTDFSWANIGDVAFGGVSVVRWIQVRGPSVGLVEPSLLNIGELIDTIQIGEPLGDDARDMLRMLVAHRGQSQPLEAHDMPLAGRAIRGDSSAVEEPALLEASGAGGGLVLFADRVQIRHRGFRGFFRKALPATKDIPLDRIASVDWHAPGPLRLGRLGLRLRSGSTGGVEGPVPEDELMFYLHQEGAFREAKAEIERRLAEHRRRAKRARPGATS